MAGSPFSNVLGTDSNSSSFKNVESTQVSDTTTETASRPTDSDGESSVGVEQAADHSIHQSGQDETQGQTDTSGSPSILT